MGSVSCQLTVFFAEPFWVGVFERTEDGHLAVSRVTFGAEPRDGEVYEFVRKNFSALRFGPTVEAQIWERRLNPKAMQRAARRQLACEGIGTRAQQALKLQREQCGLARRAVSREQREAEAQRQFELRRQKHREKHRGR